MTDKRRTAGSKPQTEKRKAMAPKYTVERASAILAEADLFGDGQTCQKWQITRQTLHNYRCKLQDSDDLLQLFTLKKRMLVAGWQDAATRTIRIALHELDTIIPTCRDGKDPEEAKALASLIHAISGSIKCVGELKIAAEALADESPSHIEG